MSSIKIVPLPGRRSDIWKHFGFQIDNNGTILNKKQVHCRECKSIIAFSGNTSNLKLHLNNAARQKHLVHRVIFKIILK